MKNSTPLFTYLSAFLLLIILWSCQSPSGQTSQLINQEIISEDGEPILVGQLDRSAWEKEAYRYWFATEYEGYELDKNILSGVQAASESLDILIFIGTWCSDSQREVPRFYKILDFLEFNMDRLQVIGLDEHPDRRNTSPQHEEVGWDIQYVPTFIILRDGKELGRILETPVVSLEADLAKILRQEEKAVSLK